MDKVILFFHLGAIVESFLAFIVIIPLASHGKIYAPMMVSVPISILRNRFSKQLLLRAVAPGPDMEMSDEAADIFFQKRVKRQRIIVWSISVQSVVLASAHGTHFLASLHDSLLENGKTLDLAGNFLLAALFLGNVLILVVSITIACRGEMLGYSEANLLRPLEKRPKKLKVIKFEELLARRQADEHVNVAPAASAGSAASMESSCVICLTELSGLDLIVELPCRHFFHDHCARQWFALQPRCPYRCEDSTGSIVESCPPTSIGARQDAEDEHDLILQTVLLSSLEIPSDIRVSEQHSVELERSQIEVENQWANAENAGLAQDNVHNDSVGEPISSVAELPLEVAESSRIGFGDEIPVQREAAVAVEQEPDQLVFI